VVCSYWLILFRFTLQERLCTSVISEKLRLRSAPSSFLLLFPIMQIALLVRCQHRYSSCGVFLASSSVVHRACFATDVRNDVVLQVDASPVFLTGMRRQREARGEFSELLDEV
jgi:hypothetical protein